MAAPASKPAPSTQAPAKQRIICVTGPMAAGKNAATSILEEQGWFCIDADQTAHQAIENRKEDILKAFSPYAATLGVTLTTPDGSINRRALAPILFSDPALLARQESIVHPEVVRIITEVISTHPETGIVLNATVLHKTPDLMQLCDTILYIDAPVITRLRRARARDGHTIHHILKRFWAQRHLLRDYQTTGLPLIRIINSGTRQDLAEKIAKL